MEVLEGIVTAFEVRVAAASMVLAFNWTELMLFGTDAVYETVEDVNVGEITPTLTDNSLKPAFVLSTAAALVTPTVYDTTAPSHPVDTTAIDVDDPAVNA
jgi:hypothetical protein